MKRNLIPVVGFFLLLSCTKDNQVPLCTPGNYFPLETGNYWVFDCYKKFSNGSVEARERDSMRVTGDTLMLGYHYYRLEGTFFARPLKVWLTAEGGRIISSDNNLYFSCPYLFSGEGLYPVAHFDFPCRIKTLRKDTLIQVPAGDFQPVMQFEARSMIDDSICLVTYTFHYVKDIGLVQWSTLPRNQEFEVRSELVSFHVR